MKSAREIIEEGMTQTSSVIKPEEKQKQDSESNAIVVNYDEKGVATFVNQNELSRVANLYIKTRLAPSHLIEEGVGAVASAITFCRQMNIPDSCMNEMAYIKGKLMQYGKLVTALAERHPEYGEKREFFINKEGDEICSKNKNIATAKPYASIIQIRKKNSSIWNEYSFSIDDAIKAGLLTKDEVSTKRNWEDATWTKYLKDMMFNKCNRRALDSNYASALKGVNYYEDMREVYESRDVTPENKSHAGELNALVE